jgi:tyrosine-protein phosphatase SIW14
MRGLLTKRTCRCARGHGWLSGAVLLAAIVGGACVFAEGQAPPGVPNFHRVGPGIYRGGAPTSEGLRALKAMHIRTIIDLRVEKARETERQAAQSLGFKWISLPMWDEAPKPQQVRTLLATLAVAPAQPVFVHCQHGCDRTGCMIGIYRVKVLGWPFSRAWAEMLQYGFDQRWTKLRDAVRQAAKRQGLTPSAG